MSGNRIWAPVLSDRCKCKASNDSERGGWRITPQADCPDHGDGRDETEHGHGYQG